MFNQGGWEPELRELTMPLELEELEESINMVGRGGGSGVAGAGATGLGFGGQEDAARPWEGRGQGLQAGGWGLRCGRRRYIYSTFLYQVFPYVARKVSLPPKSPIHTSREAQCNLSHALYPILPAFKNSSASGQWRDHRSDWGRRWPPRPE